MASSTSATSPRLAPLGIAGLASIAAGILHVGIGVGHRHDGAVLALSVLTGVAQVGWGGWALVRDGRAGAVVGAAVNASALVGWLMAKVSGIAFVDGLADPEPVGVADGLAAAAAFVALAASFRALRDAPAPSHRAPSVPTAALFAVVVAAGAVAVGAAAADQPAPLPVAAASPPLAAAADTRGENRRYDPSEPVDLSGVAGVTDQEQARAEALLTETLAASDRFADPQAALDAGYQSLGDAFTGHEHLVNWALLDDGRVLDARAPESLVYQVDDDGNRTFAAAMYMLEPGARLTTVPDVGGSLTPWHVHENICVDAPGAAATTGAVTDAAGDCPDGHEPFSPVPMLHVWVIAHPCGPFASLERVAGLDVADDQVVFCDHVHGL